MRDSIRPALRISFSYLLLSVIWILYSDEIILRLSSDPQTLTHLQSVKGLLFVLCTAALLFVLIERRLNITYKSQATLQEKERELAALNNFQRELVETTAVWINTLDLEGNITFWNRGAERISGYLREQVLGHAKVWQWLYPDPEYCALVLAGTRAILSSGQSWVEAFETGIRRCDGGERIVSWHSNPLLDQQGNVCGCISVGADVTERRQVEQRIIASEASYRELFDNMSNGVAVYQPVDGGADFVFKDINRAGERISSVTKSEIIGRRLTEVFPGAEQLGLIDALRQVSADGAPRFLPTALYDDQRIAIWVSNAVYRLPSGDVVTVYSDETERKRIEAQLLQQQKLEAIGTLAAGVAHEINNPITSILNFGELLYEQLDPQDKKSDYARRIIQDTNRVSEIVHNLLTFARQDNEGSSLADVKDIVHGTLVLVGAMLRKEQIKLNLEMAEGLPKLRCRSQQIQQVLMNLLTNARDALNEKYPTHDPDKLIELHVGLFEDSAGRWVRLTARDRGPGIDAANIRRIFDPFFTTKPRDKGTGLGLSISHGIISRHKGRLLVESEPGKGTVFHVDLPVGG